VVFEQAPDEDFDLVLDELLECSSRLFGFLEELGPFVHLGHYSLNCARAKDWLNPELVSKGFWLGQSRARRGGVTTPLLWVVRTANRWRSCGVSCVCVGNLDWTPERVSARLDSGWGLGWMCLSRYLSRFSELADYPWLTQAGLERMKELYAKGNRRRAEKEARAKAPERISPSDKTCLSRLRRTLRTGDTLPNGAQLESVQSLGEKAYSGLLTTLAARRADACCAALLRCRQPRQREGDKLLQQIARTAMYLSAQEFVKGVNLSFDLHDPSKPHVLSIAVESGDLHMLNVLLDSASEVGSDHLRYAFDAALKAKDDAILQLLATHPKLSAVRQAAMLDSFGWLYEFKNWAAAMQLLDLGLRPLQATTTRDWFPTNFLAEESLPVLKKVFQLEIPSDQNIRVVLRGSRYSGKDELNFVLGFSRTIAGHKKRMCDLMYECVASFMYAGDRESLRLILHAATEGGTLTKSAGKKLVKREFLHGDKWRERQGHLIDLIGFFRRCQFTKEIAVLSGIKRGKIQLKKGH
jgi:hypothetical protein